MRGGPGGQPEREACPSFTSEPERLGPPHDTVRRVTQSVFDIELSGQAERPPAPPPAHLVQETRWAGFLSALGLTAKGPTPGRFAESSPRPMDVMAYLGATKDGSRRAGGEGGPEREGVPPDTRPASSC
jgi:hypothetical protein